MMNEEEAFSVWMALEGVGQPEMTAERREMWDAIWKKTEDVIARGGNVTYRPMDDGRLCIEYMDSDGVEVEYLDRESRDNA